MIDLQDKELDWINIVKNAFTSLGSALVLALLLWVQLERDGERRKDDLDMHRAEFRTLTEAVQKNQHTLDNTLHLLRDLMVEIKSLKARKDDR